MKSRHSADVVFTMLLALVSTCLAYRFGVGNQLEQLPLILRQVDPGYLTNDVFVSTSTEFGPRLYFAELVAWICRVMPLPWVYFVLRFVTDLALVVVTLWAGRRILGTDRLGAMIAAVITLCVSSFQLGDATELRYELFSPASLAIPGMLLAIGLGLRGRAVLAAIVASLSSLPHPLYGVQGGAIALGTAFFALLVPESGRRASSDEREIVPRQLEWRIAITQTGIGAAILGVSILVFWWWPSQSANPRPLSTEELFNIFPRFRSPHHYLPSQFRPEDYVTTALFVFAAWLAFEQWSRSVTARTARLLLVPVVAVLVGCVAGALFTEVWPVKAVITLQPFRLLSILKWIGYLLLAWLLAKHWQSPRDRLARPLVGMSLMSSGGAFPLVTAAGLSLLRLQHRLSLRVSPHVWIWAMAIGTGLLWLRVGSIDERVRLSVAIVLLSAFWVARGMIRTGSAILTIILVLALAGNRAAAPVLNLAPLVPGFDLSDLQDVDAQTARAAAMYTPSGALFVAPPDFGVLRIVGERALVVDFEAIPFQDHQMREWRERIRVVYGEVEGGGFVALHALDQAYRRTTDAHLRNLADRYGATHAVLYSETGTKLPEVYSNETYRIVRLEAQHP